MSIILQLPPFVPIYPLVAQLPNDVPTGSLAVVLFDMATLYIYYGGGDWQPVAGGGSGNVTGSGTAGNYAMWGATTSIQNAPATVSGGNTTFTGTVAATNLSGTNHGDFTTANVDSAGGANATGMNLTAGNSSTPQALNLNSATATQPGVLNAGAQTIGGVKTFNSAPNLASLTASYMLALDGSKNIISTNGVPGFNGGYASISSGVNYTLTNPCPIYVEVTMTAASLTLILPVMNASNSLQASLGAQIVINNVGTNIFTVADQVSGFLYEILPGQNATFKVTSNASVQGAFTVVASSGSSSAAGYPDAPQTFSVAIASFLPAPVPSFSTISATAPGVSIYLPSILAGSGYQINIGQSFYIYNAGSNAFALLDESGATLISSVAPADIYQLFVLTNDTIAGTFKIVQVTNSSNNTGINHGDLTTANVDSSGGPNASGMFMVLGNSTTPQALNLTSATAAQPGVVNAGTQTFGGAKTFASTISASNLGNTNWGDLTTANVDTGGANPTGMSLVLGNSSTPQNLSLTSATASYPGVVSTGTQTFAGAKTFTGNISANNLSGTNYGDFTASNIDGGAPSPTGMSLTLGNSSTPQNISLCSATASEPGVVNTGSQTFGGAKTFSSTISASNLSGTNHGDFTTDNVFNAPNGSGMFLTNGSPSTAQVLQLTPADASNPGVMTASTQTLGGDKTFTGNVSANNLSGTNHGDFTASNIDGGAPSPTGMNLTAGNSSTPQNVSLCSATASEPGVVNTGAQTFGGVKSFNSAVVFANMTTTQKNAIASPVAGMVVFDTTLSKLCVYSGSAWQTITSV